MNRYSLPAAVAVATLVGACATTDTKTAEERAAAKEDNVYVTGSRIPRKAKDNQQSVWSTEGQGAQDMMNKVGPLYVPSGGAK